MERINDHEHRFNPLRYAVQAGRFILERFSGGGFVITKEESTTLENTDASPQQSKLPFGGDDGIRVP